MVGYNQPPLLLSSCFFSLPALHISLQLFSPSFITDFRFDIQSIEFSSWILETLIHSNWKLKESSRKKFSLILKYSDKVYVHSNGLVQRVYSIKILLYHLFYTSLQSSKSIDIFKEHKKKPALQRISVTPTGAALLRGRTANGLGRRAVSNSTTTTSLHHFSIWAVKILFVCLFFVSVVVVLFKRQGEMLRSIGGSSLNPDWFFTFCFNNNK